LDGIGLSPEINAFMSEVILVVDGERHRRMRAVLHAQMGPRALQKLTSDIEAQAETLVERALSGAEFDGMRDLAEVFSVSVMGRLAGLPEDQRMRLLEWANSSFTVFGPMNELTQSALPGLAEFVDYLTKTAARDNLAPDSWGAAFYEAGDRGELNPDWCLELVHTVASAGIDTTISAIGSAICLLADNPAEWEKLRADPTKIPAAFLEAMRMETPIQWFSRVLREDHEFEGGVIVPKDSRVMVLYGCANRDERKYPDPDRFDIDRNPTDHLAFGYGMHACVGQPLARIEGHAMLRALVRRGNTLRAEAAPTWKPNNTVRRIDSLQMTEISADLARSAT
jgi:cytochrome P450